MINYHKVSSNRDFTPALKLESNNSLLIEYEKSSFGKQINELQTPTCVPNHKLLHLSPHTKILTRDI